MTTPTEPKHLYHYTSQKGLLGILDIYQKEPKPSLWMTDILYLNDSSEYTHTLDLVKTEVKERKKQLPPFKRKGLMTQELTQEDEIVNKTHDTYEYIENFCDDLRDDNRIKFYVFSLSEEKDDLNQWRSYCPQEGGFCIEFDYNGLESLMKITKKYRMEKCKYTPDEKQKSVEYILDPIPRIFRSDIEESVKNTCIFVFSLIINSSSYIKHDSFNKEREHRIIHEGNDVDEIKYREGKSMIIPYTEFSLVDKNVPLSITKIIVGPTPHPELSKLSIEGLLKSKGYKIEVESSEVPYRSW